MLKISTKELIICVITIIALLLAITTETFATTPSLDELMNDANAANEYESITDVNNTTNNTTVNNTTNNTVNNTTSSTVNNTTNNTVNNTVNNAVNNTTNNTSTVNTVIPDTGVDYSVVFVIAIFGLSAIYAYKKIRDYKNV